MTKHYTHKPVLLKETVRHLVTDKNGVYVDGTLGMAGHAMGILSELNKQGRVIAIDWDPEMIELAKKQLSNCEEQVTVVKGNFADIDEILPRENIAKISGVLFDLGVSSLHFDKPSRGFGFKHNGPLDMRISPENPLTAYTIINKWPYEQIEHLIRISGERFSNKITKLIVNERAKNTIVGTSDLKSLIEKNFVCRKDKIHPATRTFLALRLAVNSELDNLLKGIHNATHFMAKGSRMCIITFHSLEDRIVKETFKSMVKLGGWEMITKKPVKPSDEEIENNHRARSAKLRVIEKTEA
ncbi:MAG: 16S rRNA (cytosine(1402)-N(4))-methyltransferase RsmH [Elusimicrobia bacterium]|nr:16S rRNA (cytosine(1402)-N(4))-methyltransferase RsmH [Elusimicrobiota bacterium]